VNVQEVREAFNNLPPGAALLTVTLNNEWDSVVDKIEIIEDPYGHVIVKIG
jgi:hypothetical protein